MRIFDFLGKKEIKKSEVKGLTLNLRELLKEVRKIGDDYLVVSSSEDALERVSWVYSCVRAITLSGRSVGFKVVDENGERVKKAEQIFWRPNLLITWGDLIEQTLMWMELRGVAFWLIDYPYIKILDSDLARLEFKGDSYVVHYFVNGQEIIYGPDEVVYFPNFVLSYQRSVLLPTITASMVGVELLAEADKLNLNVLKNGGFIPGYFVTDEFLTQSEIEQFREIWRARYSGFNNAGDIPIFSKGIKYEQVGLSPSDMLFVNLEKITRDRISSVFGVPSVLINIIEQVNYSTAREQRRIFWENTLIPKLSRIEERINEFVLPLLFKGMEYDFYLDYSQVAALKEDEQSKVGVYRQRLEAVISTINEIRIEEGKSPLPWGDERWRPASPDVAYWQFQAVFGNGGYGSGENEGDGKDKKRISGGLVISSGGERLRVEYGSIEHRRIWLSKIKAINYQERRFLKEVQEYFKEQKRIVLERFKDRFKGMDKERVRDLDDIGMGGDLMRMDEEMERYMRRLYKFYVIFGSQAGQSALANFGIDSQFDLSNPFIGQALREMVMGSAMRVNETTKKEIMERLSKWWDEGLSYNEMAERLASYFDEVSEVRGLTIARTEVHKVVNWSEIEAIKSEGLSVVKKWISSLDNVVRDPHREVHGTEVELDEDFEMVVDGVRDLIGYPGDPKGLPSNIINCRCVLVYPLKEGGY